MGQTNHKEVYDAFAYEDEADEVDEAQMSDEVMFGMSGLYRSESGQSV